MIGTDSMLRCPLAGASSVDIRMCPGYSRARVQGGDVDGSAQAYATCAHLGAETDGRGFFPACHHPEADWIVPAAMLMRQGAELQAVRFPRRVADLPGRVAAAQSQAAFLLGWTRMAVRVSTELIAEAQVARRSARVAVAVAG